MDNENIQPELTDEQKKIVLDSLNADPPMKLNEIVGLVFPGVDGRSKQARPIKAYIDSLGVRVKRSHEYQPKKQLILTQEQKDYICSNIATSTELEIAKILYKNDKLTNLSIEYRTISEYSKSLGDIKRFSEDADLADGEYFPPRSISRVVAKINQYEMDVNLPHDENKLTPPQRKCCLALLKYLNVYRFILQINSYDNNTERKLFESTFVRHTWNKPDLGSEDIDQFVLYASEIVNGHKIQKRRESLERLLDEYASKDGDDNKKLAVSVVDAITSLQNDHDKCSKRQITLKNDLDGKRAEKLSKLKQETSSVLNFFEAWKEEKSRQQLLQHAKLREKAIETEIDRLGSLEDIKARILGLTKEEGLQG